ncbi:protein LURP-one-related 4-like [Cornus florida]|uniref:protein LURP-one-related 4-like n=1 Tax=Cornus florida TaxID=4283 RepID=UPI0028A1FAD8|nr:protein LURP-one-related 4-like [Cornus florida]
MLKLHSKCVEHMKGLKFSSSSTSRLFFLVFQMAKVYPNTPCTPSSSHRDTYTIYMKSLVLRGNGCTVFNSNGEIVYRIDNYDSKCCSEVFLMDLKGRVLCTILRKKLLAFGYWDGYKSNGHEVKNEKPWFRVRKNYKFLNRESACQVTMGCDEAQASCFRIQGNARKSEFKIIDNEGRVVAEVKQKQSSSGIVLGEDVLSLVVEPLVDPSLLMALVAVYCLIGRKM